MVPYTDKFLCGLLLTIFVHLKRPPKYKSLQNVKDLMIRKNTHEFRICSFVFWPTKPYTFEQA